MLSQPFSRDFFSTLLDNDIKPFIGQYNSDDKPTKIILIQHKDQDLQFSAVIVDGKKDSCIAFCQRFEDQEDLYVD